VNKPRDLLLFDMATQTGAPAVQVIFLQQQATGEFYGSARAIHCSEI